MALSLLYSWLPERENLDAKTQRRKEGQKRFECTRRLMDRRILFHPGERTAFARSELLPISILERIFFAPLRLCAFASKDLDLAVALNNLSSD